MKIRFADFCIIFFVFSVITMVALPREGEADPHHSLKVRLTINKTKFLAGERPLCTLTLKNTGNEAIELLHPNCGNGITSFRVIEIQSGIETFEKRELPPDDIPQMITILPDREFRTRVDLLNKIHLSAPGEYAVSAVYFSTDNRYQAESQPIRLKITPFAVNNLFLDSVQTSEVNGVFVNSAAKPSQITLAEFRIAVKGGLESIYSAGKTSPTMHPYMSKPPNNGRSSGKWIAWIEGENLKYTHYDTGTKNNTRHVAEIKLPHGQPEIIPPLYIESADDPLIKQKGAAIIWLDGSKPNSSSMQVINLEKDEPANIAKIDGKVSIAAARPKWMMSHTLSNSTKLVTFLSYDQEKLSLYLVPWPDRIGSEGHLQKLLTWNNDEFVAGGATLGFGDEIYGATLVRSGLADSRSLELIVWKYDAKEKIVEQYRQILPWNEMLPIGSATVRVRPDGFPAVLLRSNEYKWLVWDGLDKKMKSLPAPYSDTKKALDLAFFNQSEIVLICADTGSGIMVKRLDGSDLPSDY